MRKPELWMIFFVVLCALLMAVMFYWIHRDLARYHDSLRVKPPLFAMVSCAELAAAHRYHGILYSYQSPSGTWCFDRNGQRCRLLAHLQ